MTIPAITVNELTDDVVLLDVREADEWERGRAVGAVHLAMSEIGARLADVPRENNLVVVCHLGGRSARVTELLLQQGIECRNLTGGMVAYAKAGLPLEADGDRTPAVD